MDDARLRRVLRQHVKTDQLLGVDAVPVAAVAPTGVVAEVESEAPTPVAPPAPPQPAAPPLTPPARSAAARPAPAAPAPLAPRPAAPPPAHAPAQPFSPADGDKLPPLPQYPKKLDRDAKTRLLHNMDINEVRGCCGCGLCKGRTQTVFGEGDPDAKLMFIGEGPGENEDLQGRPFVGKAGQKLDEMIKAMGLSREQVYIANIVKCRPPQNRAPMPDEVAACWDYLKRQIETIQPRVIVTLGGPSTKQLLQTERGITAIRGIWHHFNGLLPAGPAVPVMPTFHPAYLLRAYTPENRKKVWSDLQKAMKMLGEKEEAKGS